MLPPDYERLSLVYELASEKVNDIVLFVAIAHLKTNGFVFLNKGLFVESQDVYTAEDLIKLINNSIKFWNTSITNPTDIHSVYNTLYPGSLYTDIGIKDMVYEYYERLISNMLNRSLL